MPSKLVQDVLSSLTADKDWPENVVLYKSLEEQELLPDVARCYAIEALLAIHGLQDGFSTCRRQNAESMSPKNGKLPFLRIRNKVVAEEDVIEYLRQKEFFLHPDRSIKENLSIKGVMSLLETKLVPIELYFIWEDAKNVPETLQRYGYNQPKPLCQILCRRKRQEVREFLRVAGYLTKSEDQLSKELEQIFTLLVRKLEKSKYISGEQVSEADVYVFGHLQAIMESKLPNNILLNTLQRFPKLTNFCLNFNQVHLGHQAMLWEFV